MSGDPDDFLIVPEAAADLRMAKRTLDNHRWKGTGPKFRRHGGRIVYRRGDLLAWSEERAARMAARKRNSRVPPSAPAGHNGDRAPGAVLAEDEHSETVLERQREHSNWSLHPDRPRSGKEPTGGHPPP
jgi:predicted DNA-binding transcriptional regulator AlpA